MEQRDAVIATLGAIVEDVGQLARYDVSAIPDPGIVPPLLGALTETAQPQAATAEHLARLHARLTDAHHALVDAFAQSER